jgi:putative aminopeptidase FrvX
MIRHLAAVALLGALTSSPVRAQRITTADAERVLKPLVRSYGVSGAEGPVRETVRRLLPAWAKPVTDTAGNLWLTIGRGDPLVVFIAHLDEIGFEVTGIRDDGSLELARRGGFFVSLYEGRPALVHTGGKIVPGVFTPRDSAGGRAHQPAALPMVDVGTGSREATLALGVRVGAMVTMPKEYTRLAGTRATARSFDDRVGSAALLLAVRRLDRARLRHAVAFVWSVREEVGLEGARAVANSLGLTAARVHAVDTFVSADSPLELPGFALAPLGRGPVARALDNSGSTPPAYVDSLVALAKRRGIPLQVGTTNGGNDGSTFVPYGVPNVAIGWPLRYAHSPAEVVDLRDVATLAELVLVCTVEW